MRHEWLRDIVLIVLLGGVINLPFLGQEYVLNSREVRHAGIAAEMADGGDFLVPHSLGQPYIFKQPVMHIPVALLNRLFGGPSILLARLPSALFGILGGLLLYVLARRLYDRKTALWAAAILLTSPAWAALSRLARPDMVFSVALLAMVTVFYMGISLERWVARLPLFLLAGLAGGVAFLAKGPYGIFYPAVFTLSLAFFSCWGRPSFRPPRLWEWLPFLLGLFVIPLLWALSVYGRDGTAYFEMIMSQHNAATSAHKRNVFYYLGPGLKMLLPWVLLVPFVVADAWSGFKAARPSEVKEDRLQRWLHWLRHLRMQPCLHLAIPLIVLMLFCVFSIVPSKRWHYLGPWFPLAVLALAASLAGREKKWLVGSAKAALVVLALGFPLFEGVIQPSLQGWENRKLEFVHKTIDAVPRNSILFTCSAYIEEFNFFGREAGKLPNDWHLVHVSSLARGESLGQGPVSAVTPKALPTITAEAAAQGQACYLAANGRNLEEMKAIIATVGQRQVLSCMVEQETDEPADPGATWFLLQLSPKP